MTSKMGYEPSEQEKQEIDDWFAHYDALVAEGDIEAMADQALFPLNEVTDDQHGFGLASATGRERFIAQMRKAGIGSSDIEMRSSRTPHFLSPALVFVVTDAVFGSGDEAATMRYGDLLLRTPAGWRFQTMVAGGMSAEV
jgi:hypothetical protein